MYIDYVLILGYTKYKYIDIPLPTKVDDMSGTPRTQAGAYADYARIRDALNATGVSATAFDSLLSGCLT